MKPGLENFGERLDPRSGKIPHARQQLSQYPTATELTLQLLKPGCLELGLQNKRSHCSEKPSHSKEAQPLLPSTRLSPSAAMKIHHHRKKKNEATDADLTGWSNSFVFSFTTKISG